MKEKYIYTQDTIIVLEQEKVKRSKGEFVSDEISVLDNLKELKVVELYKKPEAKPKAKKEIKAEAKED